MQSSNQDQTISKSEKTTSVSTLDHSGSSKNDNFKKRFPLSSVRQFRADELKEALAGDSEYTQYISSTADDDFTLFVLISTKANGRVFYSVVLIDLATKQRATVMLGDYNGMVKFKQDLTHQLHHLNSLFNHELLQLFECASNQDKFDSMNVGDNFRVKLPNHCRVKAVKRNSEEFVYYFCGRFEREAVHNEMVLSPEPAPRFRLFQDPQNPHKQYIISRAHIDRICIVQLVCGRQYATLNISNDELKAFYDYMDFEGLTIVNPD